VGVQVPLLAFFLLNHFNNLRNANVAGGEIAQWNLALSGIQPLVLLVEDLHWCDASSLELLGRIIAQSATARVLFVATARPEFTRPGRPGRTSRRCS
jgi:hypothetical protein